MNADVNVDLDDQWDDGVDRLVELVTAFQNDPDVFGNDQTLFDTAVSAVVSDVMESPADIAALLSVAACAVSSLMLAQDVDETSGTAALRKALLAAYKNR